MEVYYNVRNIPKQDYRIVAQVTKRGNWTSKKMMEQAMYPWKNVQPDDVVAYYTIEGTDGSKYYVDADTLRMGMLHHMITITNGRIEGNSIRYRI